MHNELASIDNMVAAISDAEGLASLRRIPQTSARRSAFAKAIWKLSEGHPERCGHLLSFVPGGDGSEVGRRVGAQTVAGGLSNFMLSLPSILEGANFPASRAFAATLVDHLAVVSPSGLASLAVKMRAAGSQHAVSACIVAAKKQHSEFIAAGIDPADWLSEGPHFAEQKRILSSRPAGDDAIKNGIIVDATTSDPKTLFRQSLLRSESLLASKLPAVEKLQLINSVESPLERIKLATEIGKRASLSEVEALFSDKTNSANAVRRAFIANQWHSNPNEAIEVIKQSGSKAERNEMLINLVDSWGLDIKYPQLQSDRLERVRKALRSIDPEISSELKGLASQRFEGLSL